MPEKKLTPKEIREMQARHARFWLLLIFLAVLTFAVIAIWDYQQGKKRRAFCLDHGFPGYTDNNAAWSNTDEFWCKSIVNSASGKSLGWKQ